MNTISLTDQELWIAINALMTAAAQYGVDAQDSPSVREQFIKQQDDAIALAIKLVMKYTPYAVAAFVGRPTCQCRGAGGDADGGGRDE